MISRRSSTYIFVVLVAALLASYAYYESRGYLHGPQLTITAPADGFSTSEEILVVEGDAKNITTITLNDRPIFVDETGHFKEDVLLTKGYTVVSVSVTDRYGRINTQHLRGMFVPPAGSTGGIRPSSSTLQENEVKDLEGAGDTETNGTTTQETTGAETTDTGTQATTTL